MASSFQLTRSTSLNLTNPSRKTVTQKIRWARMSTQEDFLFPSELIRADSMAGLAEADMGRPPRVTISGAAAAAGYTMNRGPSRGPKK
jgi:hypothetical protein